ncbi:g6304 [Coccomyxa elongata]
MDEEDMPPPSKGTSFSFKTNADFRRMLETPRPQRFQEDGDEHQAARAAKRPHAAQKKKGRPKPVQEEKGEQDEPAYRDRAEERRKGFNPDYERVNADLASIVTGNSLLEQDIGKISVEDSKFLGGDVDHTHLVKGLDYALLQKVRGEMTKQGPEGDETKKKVKPVRKEEMNFVTATGRSVFNAVFNPPKINVSELFLPRRTAFVYELEDSEYGSDIPTTLRRSKLDCPQAVDSLMGGVDGNLLERLAKIMSYMRPSVGGKPGKRLKRKDKLHMLGQTAGLPPLAGIGALKASRTNGSATAEPVVVKPADEDEDIFGDAGKDYQAELPKSRSGTSAPSAQGQYFDKKDDMADLPALPKAGANMEEDMEIEDEEAVPGPPGSLPLPPPPPPPDAEVGPARPPANADLSGAYADPAAYEAYVHASVAYQASTDPEYQALLAAQAGIQAPSADDAAAASALSQQQKEAGLASVFKRDDDNLARRREVDEREKEPGFVSDAYAECYPEYHGYNNTIVDSDDEADFSHMDSKTGGKSRTDFDTEEQWQEYKNSKEMLPKAAFQFGVKAADGRKAGNKLGKARDNKLNSQLNKIQAILEKDGGDYKKAFTASQLESSDGSKVSKKRRI